MIADLSALRSRNLAFMANPQAWSHYPFLPVVRRRDSSEDVELGVLFDARGVLGRLGFSATVFRMNLFLPPANETELFALPREVFETWEQLIDAGWYID